MDHPIKLDMESTSKEHYGSSRPMQIHDSLRFIMFSDDIIIYDLKIYICALTLFSSPPKSLYVDHIIYHILTC